MILLENLILLLSNVGIDFDGYYGDQCVDWVQVWHRNLGGTIPFSGDAKDIINQPGNLYTKILNTPTGVPVKGDIIVWDGSYNGGPGHVGVATGKADINTFEVFEQNDPTGSKVHLKTYSNYNHVTGWLHPKIMPTPPANSDKLINAIKQAIKILQDALS